MTRILCFYYPQVLILESHLNLNPTASLLLTRHYLSAGIEIETLNYSHQISALVVFYSSITEPKTLLL